jgi:hypothetical protein
MNNRLRVAGILSGILIAVGGFGVLTVPAGGDVTTQDFISFYSSSGKRLTALLSYFVLIIACWLLVWLFSELRVRLAPGARAEMGHRLGVGGALMLIVGGGILLAPVGVQENTPGSKFVGPVIAHTLGQAGLLPFIAGVWTIAVGIFLTSHRMRTSGVFPGWLAIFGMVVAVLLIGSYVAFPIVLLPIWAIVVGITGARAGSLPTAERSRKDVDATREVTKEPSSQVESSRPTTTLDRP